MIYFQLFLSYFQIGALSFGGGYAAMPLIQSQIVEYRHWLTMRQFTDLVTIAEMTPGPIAVNSATFVGNQVAGIGGALAASFGCVLPSCIVVTLLAKLYLRCRNLTMIQDLLAFLRPVVVAMIASAGVQMLISVLFPGKTADIHGMALFAAALFLLRKTRLSPILIMTGCGIAELLWQTFF